MYFMPVCKTCTPEYGSCPVVLRDNSRVKTGEDRTWSEHQEVVMLSRRAKSLPWVTIAASMQKPTRMGNGNSASF